MISDWQLWEQSMAETWDRFSDATTFADEFAALDWLLANPKLGPDNLR